MKANCIQEAIEVDTEHISQIYDYQVFASCWLDGVSNFDNTGYGGLNWCDYSINITVIHYEVPSIFSRFKSWTVN